MTELLIILLYTFSLFSFSKSLYQSFHENQPLLSCKISRSGEAIGFLNFNIHNHYGENLQSTASFYLCLDNDKCIHKRINLNITAEYYEQPAIRLSLPLTRDTKYFTVIAKLNAIEVKKVCSVK